MTVLLVVEPSQITSLKEDPLWFNNANNQDDFNNHNLFLLFNIVVGLEDNMKLDQNDRHVVEFYEFLQRLCNGNNTESAWDLLCQKFSRYATGINSWRNERFDSTECVHL